MRTHTRAFFVFVSIIASAFFCGGYAHAIDDSTWQSDWSYSKNDTAKTITLNKYNGSEETYEVPAKAVINETEYSVILGSSSVNSTSIKNLSVEDGVKINSLYYFFYQATNLESVDLTGADTSSVASMQGMFYGATNLKKIVLSGLDFSNVTNVRYMLYQAYNVEEVDLSDTDMSKVTTFAYSSPSNSYASTLFMGMSGLRKVNFNNFNTDSLTTAERMFIIHVSSYQNTNHIEEIDVTNWNIKNVTTLYEAFKYCGYNNDIVITGLETLDVGNVKNFSSVFQSGVNIKDLSGVESWNTSNATTISSMFSECESITSLDLSGWDTANVTDISSAFFNAKSLTELNVSTWNTSNVTQMQEAFKGCASLEILNLKNWTSEKVISDYGMYNMLGNPTDSPGYPITPLREITLNDNFKFFGLSSAALTPGLRSGYWHLKEGTEDETSKKFSSARLYSAYNNGITPPSGYGHDHTYVLTELDPATAEYYAQGWGNDNAWEVHYPSDRFKAYCINLRRGAPSGYYDRTLVFGNSIIDEGFLDSDDYGWEPLGANMEEALITLIYYGYSNDADGIQERYNLTDDQFLLLTQNAIWNFTDRYSDMRQYDGDSDIDKAYRELVSKRFSEIPNNENLKLYLYESIDGRQNLLSISGLSDVSHAGVRVLKLTNALDGSSEPLIGAEFTIYNSDHQPVATIVSDENGYATKYNTDSIYGIPEGIYTIRETGVPRGYIGTDDYYSFIVRKDDDNEIITIGKLDGSSDEVAMIFDNDNDESVEGGGLIIEIVDGDDNMIPIGATFEILDENGVVIDTVTTTENGDFKTGKKDLLLNKKYTVRLKNPPAGYFATIEIQDETLTENEQYKTLVFKFIKKRCKVNLEATKEYNSVLKKGDFEFELQSINGGNSFRAFNDENGKVNFDLEFDADNLGYEIFNLREVNNNLEDVSYDTHSEEVVIEVLDEGDEELVCRLEDQDFNLTFVNEIKTIDPPDSGESTMNDQANASLEKVMGYVFLAQFIIVVALFFRNRVKSSAI